MAKQETPSTDAECLDACSKFLAEYDQANGGNYFAHRLNGDRIAAYVHNHYGHVFTPENIAKAFQKLNGDLMLLKTREEEALLSADEYLKYSSNVGIPVENDFGRFAGWNMPYRVEQASSRPRQDGRVRSLADAQNWKSYPWEEGRTLTKREYVYLSAEETRALHSYPEANNIEFGKVVR